jgi:hypothetical protein
MGSREVSLESGMRLLRNAFSAAFANNIHADMLAMGVL